MQIIKKLVFIAVILIFAVSVTPRKVNAAGLKSIISGGDSFLVKAKEDDREIFNEKNQKETMDQVYYLMLSIGIILTFLVGVVLGIQFITSGVEGQAKVKEKLIPFLLGAVVIFGAFGIWRLVYNLLNGFFN